jgi:hypothetical protein
VVIRRLTAVPTSRWLIAGAMSLDLGVRLVQIVAGGYQPHLSWLASLGPWVVLWAFAIRRPAGICAFLLVLRTVGWIVYTLVAPVHHVVGTLVLVGLIAALQVAAWVVDPASQWKRTLRRMRRNAPQLTLDEKINGPEESNW